MYRLALQYGILFMLLALAFTPAFGQDEEADKGAGFPDFNLENLDGDNVSDEDAFADAEIILIDFFTYYCKPCKKMWPHLNALQEEYGELGLKVVLFDEDDPEGLPLSRSYLKQKEYTFEVLFDIDGEIEAFYSVEKQPTTIMLDSGGNVIYKHEGYNKGDEEEFREFIAEYLEEIEETEEVVETE
jgi:thiol-disulfide isomerase/thioredoxin